MLRVLLLLLLLLLVLTVLLVYLSFVSQWLGAGCWSLCENVHVSPARHLFLEGEESWYVHFCLDVLDFFDM